MTFRAVLEYVRDHCRLNTNFFAEAVTYTPAGAAAVSIPVHVRYRRREIRNDQTGDARIVDEIKVEISREDLPDGPVGGDRLVRAGETRPYLYAYAGGETNVSWRAVFHREIVSGQRTRTTGGQRGAF